MNEHAPCSFFLTPTNLQEIKEIMTKTTQKSAAGIDETPGQIIKAVAEAISKPLSHIINESFLHGKYPDNLKISKSIHIYKNKGSKN